jgi:hypothetical protein
VNWTAVEGEENKHFVQALPLQFLTKQVAFQSLESDVSNIRTLFSNIYVAQDELLKKGKLTDEQTTQYLESLKTLD